MSATAPRAARAATGGLPGETGAADTAVAPRADCVADRAGGITFTVTGPGGTGPARLLLRLRGGERETGLPLTPDGAGRLRGVLPAGAELAEGRWDVHLQRADGAARRLVAGLQDLRALVDRVPADSRAPVAVRLPYTTKYGNLTVRSWLRAPHAEAGELRVGARELGVRGRVYGTSLTPDAYVEAADRAGVAPAARTGLDADGDVFRCAVPLGSPAPGIRDLWLRPAGEAGPRVRIARLLDDVADKKHIFAYPKVTLGTAHGAVLAGPYYTADNDLSIVVVAAG
ncbi:hypothetical protein GCM10010145_28690 [Streptomyces ruber]|uniref:Transferase n=2 Tax=Streptomyces TaxID=1883 RepID=A0A918EQN6_9ACTN|nr:hypothetical protein [Streptomyces ruber]GGQ57126.1 hypothetical protein GCM10010145_28690 [Streptomyces ruber]